VGQHAKFTPFLFFQNNKSQIKKLTTENKKLKNQNKKLKDKNKKLKEQVENLKCKNENLREEYDNLYNSKIIKGKEGPDSNSRVKYTIFLLLVLLVCKYNVSQSHVVDVVITVMKWFSLKPVNFPGSRWVQLNFQTGRVKYFMFLCVLSYLNTYCEFQYLTLGSDSSSVKGLSVNCLCIFAYHKLTKKIKKIPFFFYETVTKYADLNLEIIITELKTFDELQKLKYTNSFPIIARFSGSCTDSDPALICLLKSLEKISLRERKNTNLPEINAWIKGSCSQHNTSSNLIVFFFIIIQFHMF